MLNGKLARVLVGIILVGVSAVVYLNARSSNLPIGSWVAFYVSGVVMPLAFAIHVSRQSGAPFCCYAPLIVGWVTIITALRLITG